MSDKDKSFQVSDDAHRKAGGRKGKTKRMPPPTRGEALVKGVFMGIIISGVTHASKTITSALIRHPITLFSTGVVTGYLTHKYRKEIVAAGSRTAVESKNFVLRQKENLLDLIAESREHGADSDKSR